MSVVPLSLDSSIRDVPPSTLAPDEKVEQPSAGTLCVTDRQRSPLLEAEQNMAPAAERTGPLPLGPWTEVFEATGGYDGMTSSWDICDASGNMIATVDLRLYGQKTWWDEEEKTAEFVAGCLQAEAVARLVARAWELR